MLVINNVSKIFERHFSYILNTREIKVIYIYKYLKNIIIIENIEI